MRTITNLLLALLLFVAPAAWAGPVATAAVVEAPVAFDAPAMPVGYATVSVPGVRVHGPGDASRLLHKLADHAVQAVPRLADDLGVPIGGDVDVWVADSEERFRSLQPGLPPAWADGTAWPAARTIFLHHPRLRPGGARPLHVVLDHELVHVLLGQAFHPHPVPHWLQEGMAQVYAGETGPEISERIARGTFGGGTLSLASLTKGFPNDAQRADLAYAQSADFILWFREQFGEPALHEVVRDLARGRTVEGAVLDATGHTLTTLGETWEARLRTAWMPWVPQQLDTAAMALAGLALVGVGLWRRRAWRKRLASWERADGALAAIARDLLRRRSTSPVAHR